MEILLLIIFLVLALPVVYVAPMAFMGAVVGMSGRVLVIILVTFGLAGLYLYGLHRFYHFLKPFAQAIPDGFVWLIVPVGILCYVLRKK